MEDLRTIYHQLLNSDGTGQAQRLSPALEENYVQLEDRNTPQLLRHLYHLSKELNFFSADSTVNGDWSFLFKRFLNNYPSEDLISDRQIEAYLAVTKNIEPQLALLLAFFKILNHSKKGLNGITQRHLEFYFRDILKFSLREGSSDKVHVLFELNKNALPQRIGAGTILDAGKGPDGIDLHYKTTSEIVVNQAKITSLKSLFIEKLVSDQAYQLWSATYDDPENLPGNILPFGSPQSRLPVSGRTMQSAGVGLAFSSSLLFLSGGDRTILVTIYSEPYAAEVPIETDINTIVEVYLSGQKEWIRPQLKKVVIRRSKVDTHIAQLQLELKLNETQPGIVGHNQQVHHGGFQEGIPVLKIASIDKIKIPDYFNNFRIASVEMGVQVNGLPNLVLQNDEGILVSNGSVPVFGSWPAIGSRFFIGSQECFQKNLKSFEVNISWKNPPSDFKKYYEGYYPSDSLNIAVFTASLEILLNGKLTGHELRNSVPLFNVSEKNYGITISVSNEELKKVNDNIDIGRDTDMPNLSEGFRLGISRGFISLTLNGPEYENFSAFGHNNYASALSGATMKIIQNPAGGTVLPLAPYTPQAKEISLNYKASDTIFPGSVADRVYHITPFGVQKLTKRSVSLFPQYEHTGYCFIGISNLQSQQQVNLLMRLAESSSVEINDYQSDFSEPKISWSYLAGDEWIELQSDHIAVNTTQNFQQSGIIAIQSGPDASTIHDSMPAGQIWLRAGLIQGLNRIPPFQGVFTQAVEALLEILPDQKPEDFTQHLAAGLLPNSIKRTIPFVQSLKSVKQPFPSFGGRQPELKNDFITRLSERIRHRNRAIHAWDFERLVLETFPAIAKVKCLTGSELGIPGTTMLLVIPKVNVELPVFKRLQPKATSFFLSQVQQYLAKHSSPFSTVTINNPDYEELLTDFKVKFKAGFDPLFYLGKLNEDIIRFLSPWAFDEKTALHFDTTVYRSETLYFIEKLTYVDYVADFKLFHLNAKGGSTTSREVIGKMKIGKTFVINKFPVPNLGGMTIGNDFIVGVDWEVVKPSQASAILVSVPQHTITTMDTTRICTGISGLGIGSMTVDLDFLVSRS